VAQLVEQALYALLRRFEQAPLEKGVERGVVLAFADLDPEYESARLDDRAEVLEARLVPADFPSSDLGAVTAEALGEPGVRQAEHLRGVFDEHINPELRIVRRGSKTILIPVAEIERWREKSAMASAVSGPFCFRRLRRAPGYRTHTEPIWSVIC
jgi:hypothetical protein